MIVATTLEGAVQNVTIRAGEASLQGQLALPAGASAIVLFAHGSGSGRHSPRNQFVADRLRQSGLGTLLIDLLTEEEELIDRQTAHLRFDIPFLALRLTETITWLARHPHTAGLRYGLFGASTGAGAALVAAAREPGKIGAVVSRGGRPDLAGQALGRALCPTLLLVGGDDTQVVTLNEVAFEQLAAPVKELKIIPGASHLFEETGKLGEVARLAADWFTHHLGVGAGTYAG